MIGKPAMWRIQLENGTSPNCCPGGRCTLEGRVHPRTTAPGRRSGVPVRMIVKRNENKRLAELPDPKTGQMMKIARSEKAKRGNLSSNFLPKRIDDSSRSAITELR